MARWTFEPGHTAAEFCVRHMMVTYVRGAFKNVEGALEWDGRNLKTLKVQANIDARSLWTGSAERDAHLKSADFIDAERFPTITFRSREVELAGANEAFVKGDLTIRGVTKPVALRVFYLGEWQTPWWEDGMDKGPRTRAGFLATAELNRLDFGASWNGSLENGGVVVGENVTLTLDAEAILDN